MVSLVVVWAGAMALDTSLIIMRVAGGYPVHSGQWKLLLLLLSIAVWHTIYCLVLYPRYSTPFKHLPTPSKRHLLTGNEHDFFRTPQWTVARKISETVRNDGLIRYYTVLNQERLLVTSTKGLSEVLVQRPQDWDHPPFMKFAASRITGNGLQFAHADEHKLQRKHLMPAFSPGHVKTLIPTFWDQTVKMVHGIEASLRQSMSMDNAISMTDWSTRAALDIIGVAGMGVEFNSLSNPNNEYSDLTKLYRDFMSTSNRAFPWIGLLTKYFDPHLLEYIPEPQNLALSRAFKNVQNTARAIIAVRKEKLRAQQSEGQTEGKDIITVSLSSGIFSEEALLHHVMTSLVVGHISTSITFDWVCFELGQRPQMQTRLREEIRSYLPGGRLEEVNATEIESLPFLNAVCSETLRFYPPLALALREAVRDTRLLGTHVPKGTAIAWCADAINHDKTLWGPDAHEFNPERWMGVGKAGSGGAANNFAFLTFSAGPRNCIGQWWERAELACMVAAVIGRFEIELANKEEAARVDRAPAYMPRAGVSVRMKPVGGW